jgi:hypothetical protein
MVMNLAIRISWLAEADRGWRRPPRGRCRAPRSRATRSGHPTRRIRRRRPSSPPGWSIRRTVKTARRYRTIEIQARQHVIAAADPLPDDLRQALDAISHASGSVQ